MDWQTHSFCNKPGKNIAKVPSGYRNIEFLRTSKLIPGVEIVDNLSQYPGPVNRVYRTQSILPFKIEVGKYGLHLRLTVVKTSLQGNVVNIVVQNGCHLPLL